MSFLRSVLIFVLFEFSFCGRGYRPCCVTIFWMLSLYDNHQRFFSGAISVSLRFDLFKINFLYCGFLPRKARANRLQLIFVPAVMAVCTGIEDVVSTTGNCLSRFSLLCRKIRRKKCRYIYSSCFHLFYVHLHFPALFCSGVYI